MDKVYDLYARMSEADDELGIDRQLEDLHDFVTNSLKGEVGDIYVDNDISATKGKPRPDFERLLARPADVAKRPIAVWHIDRLLRVSKDLERVIELGVNVHARQSGHLDLSTPAGRAVARTVTAWTTYEGEQKAERQKLANIQRARAGRPSWARRPFGYNRDHTIRETEAASVRQAYDDVLNNIPLTSIARSWNDLGHLTSEGNTWTPTSIRPLLLAGRNAGILVYQGQEFGPGSWPALVSEDTYRSVTRILTDPNRNSGGGGARKHLLTGVAVCVCGQKVKAAWRGRKGQPDAYKIYRCSGPNNCSSGRLEWLDDHARAYAIKRVMAPDAADLLLPAEEGSDLEALRAETVRLRTKLDEIAEDYDNDGITRKQMLDMTANTRAKLTTAQSLLSRREADNVLAPLIRAKDPRRQWDDVMTLDQRRNALLALVTSVTLMPRGNRSHMLVDDVKIVDRPHKRPHAA